MPLSEGRINREDCGRNGIRRKNGGMVGGGTDSPDAWVASDRLSVRLPLLSFLAPQNPEDGEP